MFFSIIKSCVGSRKRIVIVFYKDFDLCILYLISYNQIYRNIYLVCVCTVIHLSNICVYIVTVWCNKVSNKHYLSQTTRDNVTIKVQCSNQNDDKEIYMCYRLNIYFGIKLSKSRLCRYAICMIICNSNDFLVFLRIFENSLRFGQKIQPCADCVCK